MPSHLLMAHLVMFLSKTMSSTWVPDPMLSICSRTSPKFSFLFYIIYFFFKSLLGHFHQHTHMPGLLSSWKKKRKVDSTLPINLYLIPLLSSIAKLLERVSFTLCFSLSLLFNLLSPLPSAWCKMLKQLSAEHQEERQWSE